MLLPGPRYLYKATTLRGDIFNRYQDTLYESLAVKGHLFTLALSSCRVERRIVFMGAGD
jgi:hypothetical protein